MKQPEIQSFGDPLRLRELRIITKCYHLAFQIRYNIYDENRNKREYERVAKALSNDLLRRSPLAQNATDEVNNDLGKTSR
jgi:hypothetical protein